MPIELTRKIQSFSACTRFSLNWIQSRVALLPDRWAIIVTDLCYHYCYQMRSNAIIVTDLCFHCYHLCYHCYQMRTNAIIVTDLCYHCAIINIIYATIATILLSDDIIVTDLLALTRSSLRFDLDL